VIRAETTGVVGDGDALGRRLAHMLLQDGGAELLDRTPHGVTDPRSDPHACNSGPADHPVRRDQGSFA